MAIKTTTLRPGLLVSLKTSVSGNVTYQKRMLEQESIVDGVSQARWETTRVIVDPVEHELAKKARNTAGGLIRSVCAASAFGLLCPEDAADVLENQIAEARKLATEFNKSAVLSRVTVYVITGRISPDDAEAVKAINSEVRDLLVEMEDGIKNADVKVIRDAASRVKQISAMLSTDSEARVRIAIDTAREVAKRMVKAGGQPATAIDLAAIRKIAEQRKVFLDLDEAGAIAAPEAVGVAVDLESLPSGAPVPAARQRLDLE